MVNVKIDLVGRTFGRLRVLERADDYISPKGERKARWLCECNCKDKNKVVINGNSLTKKNGTRSCGCLHKEAVALVGSSCRKINQYSDIMVDEYGEYYIGLTSNTNKEFYVDAWNFDKIKNYCWMEQFVRDYSMLVSHNDSSVKIIKMTKLLGFKNYDHADKNPLNNREYNMRLATISQQNMNRHKQKNNTSGFIGVNWDKNKNKWAASINIDKIHKHLGYFEDKTSALKVRLQAESKYYGEFAPQRHLYEQYGITHQND